MLTPKRPNYLYGLGARVDSYRGHDGMNDDGTLSGFSSESAGSDVLLVFTGSEAGLTGLSVDSERTPILSGGVGPR